tara:strand:+ start:100 stop:294 length:195 start_codon:yes stop_codon:yes gene_type:complete
MNMEWKEIKTNKELAIENLLDIVEMMNEKVNNTEKHGINDSGVSYLKHYSEMIKREIERYNFKL